MVGAMLDLHKSLLLAGLQLSLFLNPTGKFAWRVDCQQACVTSLAISYSIFYLYDGLVSFFYVWTETWYFGLNNWYEPIMALNY